MDKSSSLYKLVRSLDKKEISIVRKSLKKRENLEVLFFLYLKNEQGIECEKFQKKESEIKNLSVARSRLYTLILKELVNNNTIDNDKITLNEIDNNFLVLTKKGLIQDALQEVKKGYLFAEKLGDSFYILNFTRRLLQIRIIISEKHLPVEWFSDEILGATIKSAVIDIYILVNFMFDNDKHFLSELEFKQPSFLDINEEVIERLITSTKINYYMWETNVARLKKDKQSIFIYIKAIKVFDEVDINNIKGGFWKNTYYALNVGLILVAIEWNYKEIAEEYLMKVRTPSGLLKEMADGRAKEIWPFESFRLLFLCKFDPNNKKEIIDLVEQVIAIDKKVHFLKQGLSLYHFSICNAFFILQNDELFFEYAYRILSITKNDKYYSESIYFQTRLMELMLNFEQKKFSHNTKLVQALKNHIWNTRGNLHPFEKKFFSLFSNTIYAVSKKDVLLFITNFELELETEEYKDFIIHHAALTNFSFWLNRIKENY